MSLHGLLFRAPAMSLPSFTPTILYESGRTENSVTITTLPAPASAGQPPPAPAPTPAPAPAPHHVHDIGGGLLQQSGFNIKITFEISEFNIFQI